MARTRFGEWLEAQIREKDWTLRQAAQAIGVEQSSISRYINGVAAPSRANLRKIAAFFGADREELEAMLDADKSGVLDDRPNSPTSAPRKFGSYTEAGESGKETVEQLMEELSDPDVVLLSLNSDGIPKRISRENLRIIAEALRRLDAEGAGGNLDKE